MKFNCNFNVEINVLVDKARKAYSKIKKNPFRVLEKIFDILISPILLYCSEIWGKDMSLNNSSNSLEKYWRMLIAN